MAGTKRRGGEEMSWIGRKLFLYNVTIGLYAMDWWERYLFSILHFLMTPNYNFSVLSQSSHQVSGPSDLILRFGSACSIPYLHQSGRNTCISISFLGFHAVMRLYYSSCFLRKLVSGHAGISLVWGRIPLQSLREKVQENISLMN